MVFFGSKLVFRTSRIQSEDICTFFDRARLAEIVDFREDVRHSSTKDVSFAKFTEFPKIIFCGLHSIFRSTRIFAEVTEGYRRCSLCRISRIPYEVSVPSVLLVSPISIGDVFPISYM